MMIELTDDTGALRSANCIICGENNGQGLNWKFCREADGVVYAEGTVPKGFQGFDGIVHGGIIAAILDDAMWWALYYQGDIAAMTAEMTVRYRSPVRVDDPLRVEANLEEGRGRRYRATARLIDPVESDVLAVSDGTYLVPRSEQS